MSLTLTTTWGGESSNAYVTLAEAAVLVDELFHTEGYIAMEDTDKAKALVLATRHIDSYNWHGSRYFYRQALQYPRTPYRYDDPMTQSFGVPDTGFATFVEQDEYLRKQKARVQRACVIQAAFIASRNMDPERRSQFLGIGSQSTSRAGVSQSESYVRPAHRLCPEAMDELRVYRSSPRLVRGSGSGTDLYD